ncbi:hypothetical protein MAP00_007665 [Monascus purpureus]|nr:hypothetical protein MAP00_007665 [Monascus purpureus]
MFTTIFSLQGIAIGLWVPLEGPATRTASIVVGLLRTAEDIIMGIGGSKATDKAGQAISNHPEIVK